MATSQVQRFCGQCGKNTLHSREYFGDGWGCLLTLITAGLFLPVWLVLRFIQFFAHPYRCQTCGSST